jgi:GDP-L-fucose synthase
MNKEDKIYIAGHRGMVGSAIKRKLEKEGYHNSITATSQELDLRNQAAVNDFFAKEKPNIVVLAAAKVGGIHANNTYKADFIYDNLLIEINCIHAAFENKVNKLLFLGSSCIYPKACPQPIKEEYLLTGSLEETNKPYALAKIAGISLCQSYNEQHGTNFISAMPTNLYGPNDNYDLKNSHVLPALLRKFHEAKEEGISTVEMWGTGKPRREFLHVDDLADACYFLLQNYNSSEPVNVGCGEDLSIGELAQLINEIVGGQAEIVNDTSKPDGTLRKLLSVDKLNQLGWKASIGLREGIENTYKDFLKNYSNIKEE